MHSLETYLAQTNLLLSLLCQFFSMLVILVGVSKALALYARDLFTSRASLQAIQQMRLEIGQTFSLALAFLIGTSILKTGFAPSWNDIGQLAAIIAIRTTLNYFLLQSITHNQTDSVSKEPMPGLRWFRHLMWARGNTGIRHRCRSTSPLPNDSD